MRPALAAVLARLGQPAEAWQALEEDLGRGLLDELAAREDQRLAPAERARLRELTAELERLDKLVESTPKDLDQAERAKRFEELKRQRELASIALGEFQTKLVQELRRAGGPGRHAERNPGRAARRCRTGRLGRYPTRGTERGRSRRRALGRGRPLPGHPGLDPDRGDRSRTGCGPRTTAGSRAGSGRSCGAGPVPADQNCGPWSSDCAPSASSRWPRPWAPPADGLPPARRLIVLPSRAMAGIPVEALLALDDSRTVSYAPSGTVFKYLREQPRPDRHAGLLALGDPVYDAARQVERPQAAARPRPAGQRGRPRLQRRDPRPESRGMSCSPTTARPCQQEGRPQGRGRGRQADRRRGLERRAVVPARPGRRASSASCSTPGRHRSRSPRIARSNKVLVGGARGRRGLRPLAGHAIRGRGARPALQSRRSADPRLCSGPTRASPSWTAWPLRASWAGSASSTWRPTA